MYAKFEHQAFKKKKKATQYKVSKYTRIIKFDLDLPYLYAIKVRPQLKYKFASKIDQICIEFDKITNKKLKTFYYLC